MHNCPSLSAFCLAATLALPFAAPAQTPALTFTKIADSNTTAPGHQAFVNFGMKPSVSGGVVAFEGVYVVDKAATSAIYTAKGDASNLTTVVDTTATAPGFGKFRDFDDPTISGSTLAFIAESESATQAGGDGVYTATVGASGVTKLADTTTLIPAHKSPYTDFVGPPAVNGTSVAFFGGANGAIGGIYTGTAGTPQVFKIVDTADTSTDEPRTYVNFAGPSISGTTISLTAQSLDHSGLYAGTVGAAGVTKLVGDTTASPGTGGLFKTFEQTSVSGSTVAFTALYTGTSRNNEGVYTTVIGTPGVNLVANTAAAVLAGGANFTEFDKTPVIVGNTVAFLGYYSGGQGIFTSTGGKLTPVITTDGQLFGKQVIDLEFGPAGYDGSQITFYYGLGDGTRGVAVVTVGGGGGTGASTVSVAATVPSVPADGSGGPAKFTITRGGDLSKAIVVKYNVKGTAERGVDYETLKGKKKFNAGKASVVIKVVPEGDGSHGKRTVKLVVLPEDGYTLGDTPRAKVKLIGR